MWARWMSLSEVDISAQLWSGRRLGPAAPWLTPKKSFTPAASLSPLSITLTLNTPMPMPNTNAHAMLGTMLGTLTHAPKSFKEIQQPRALTPTFAQ